LLDQNLLSREASERLGRSFLLFRNSHLLNNAQVPLHADLKFFSEYNNIINGPGIFVPFTSNSFTPLSENIYNVPKFYSRNIFILNTLLVINGGAVKHMLKTLKFHRVGGSTQDKVNYLATYADNSKVNYKFLSSISDLQSDLLGRDFTPQVLMPLSETLKSMKVNMNATAGIPFRSIGIKDKGAAVPACVLFIKIIYTAWCLTPHSLVRPREIWGVGARPKLINIAQKIVKIRVNEPCSRVISVASSMEQFISATVYYLIERRIKARFNELGYGIAIGCKRHGDDWIKMSQHFKGSSFAFIGDFSKFDQSVPRNLMEKLLEFILSTLDDKDVYTKNFKSNFRHWFQENLITKVYNIEGFFKCVIRNGMPSGSLWTSIGDSIINYIIIKEAMLGLGVFDYKPLIYGDDHVIIVNESIDPTLFKIKYVSYVRENFGMRLSPTDSYISLPNYYFVNYKRPVFSTLDDLSGGTSHLTPIRFQRSRTPFTDYNHAEGTTHRWNYSFGRRIKFLQYYWLESGLPIRPFQESLIRIVNPEDPILTPYEHEVTCLSHLIDNYNNAHMRNWAYHILYDLEFQKSLWRTNGSAIPDEAQFFGNKETFHTFMTESRSPGDRGWYRRVSDKIDLRNSPIMQAFNEKWSRLEALALTVANSSNTFEIYEMKDLLVQAMRRGAGSFDGMLKAIAQKKVSLADVANLYLNPDHSLFLYRDTSKWSEFLGAVFACPRYVLLMISVLIPECFPDDFLMNLETFRLLIFKPNYIPLMRWEFLKICSGVDCAALVGLITSLLNAVFCRLPSCIKSRAQA
jgi:hypothetical protein